MMAYRERGTIEAIPLHAVAPSSSIGTCCQNAWERLLIRRA
jgi:hypothetical protein